MKVDTKFYSGVTYTDEVSDYLNNIQETVNKSLMDSWIDDIHIVHLQKDVLVVVKVCTMKMDS